MSSDESDGNESDISLGSIGSEDSSDEEDVPDVDRLRTVADPDLFSLPNIIEGWSKTSPTKRSGT